MKVSFALLDNWVSDWRSYVAEFLGTLIFVFLATSVVIVDSLHEGVGKAGEALAIGLVYLPLLYATVNLSGGFLNPAITLALWLCQRISGTKAVFFILAQLLASVAASALVFLIFGAWAQQFAFGMPTLGIGISGETAIAVEAILTAGLVFVVFATVVDNRGPVSFGPLSLSATVAAYVLIFGPITGGIANFSRVLGPAVYSNSYSNLFVYLVGGLIGCLFGLVYELVFLRKSKKK